MAGGAERLVQGGVDVEELRPLAWPLVEPLWSRRSELSTSADDLLVADLVPLLPDASLPDALAWALASDSVAWFTLARLGARGEAFLAAGGVLSPEQWEDGLWKARASGLVVKWLRSVAPLLDAVALETASEDCTSYRQQLELAAFLPGGARSGRRRLMALLDPESSDDEPLLLPDELADALTELIALLDDEFVAKCLTRLLPMAAHDDSKPKYRARALVALAPLLHEPYADPAIQRAALSLAHTLEDGYRVKYLAALLPRLSPELVGAAVKAARDDFESSPELLGLAAASLGGDERHALVDEALTAALAKPHAWSWGSVALTALTPSLDREQLERVLLAARTIGDSTERALALGHLSQNLDLDGRIYAARAALVAARSAPPTQVGEIFGLIGPFLPASDLDRALDIAAELDAGWRVDVLAALAPALDGRTAQRGIRMLGESGNPGRDGVAMATLAARLPQHERLQALNDAIGLAADEHVSAFLAKALGQLEHLVPDEFISKLVSLASRERLDDQWGPSLASLLLRLPERERSRRLVAAQVELAFLDDAARSRAVIALAPLLPTSARDTLLDAARMWSAQLGLPEAEAGWAIHIACASSAPDWEAAVAAVASVGKWIWPPVALLARRVPVEHLAGLLDQVAASKLEEQTARSLGALAPRLVGDLLTRALDMALELRDDEARASALCALLDRLAGEDLLRALGAALEAATRYDNALWFDWAKALTVCGPHLTRVGTERCHEPWARTMRGLARRSRGQTVKGVGCLAAGLQAIGGLDAVGDVVEVTLNSARWWP